MGILFSGDAQMYVYPGFEDGNLITVDKMRVKEKMKYLFIHFLTNQKLIPLEGYEKMNLSITRKMVMEEIRNGNDNWKDKVPEIVAREIIAHQLFDFKK